MVRKLSGKSTRCSGPAMLAGTLGLLLFAVTGRLPAQEPGLPAELQPRVRISSVQPGGSASVGTLLGAAGDTLLLQRESAAAPLAIPLQSIGRIEVSTGRHGHPGRGALIGLLAGTAAGAGFGLAVCGGGACNPHYSVTFGSSDATAGIAVFTGLVGGVLGAGVGALAGTCFRTERWREVSLHELRVGAGAHGGMALSVRVRPRR